MKSAVLIWIAATALAALMAAAALRLSAGWRVLLVATIVVFALDLLVDTRLSTSVGATPWLHPDLVAATPPGWLFLHWLLHNSFIVLLLLTLATRAKRT